jgi:hypothetical protein
VRLMLAEHLARDNRREEAIEQLQTLHGKLEAEGRSAEARATLDRMKAIDPNVEPRPSGAYQSIKSNELVFLDIDDMPATRRNTPRHNTPIPAAPAARAPQAEAPEMPTVEPSSTALDGLTLTFVPDEATPADAASTDLLDGFTATGEQTRITPGAVAPIDDFDTGREEPAPLDAEFPSLIDIPAVAETDDEGDMPHLEVEGFADETMSGSEFAALELEPLDAPVDERPHDLALPTELPLIRFTDEVLVVDGPVGSDSSPSERSTGVAPSDPASDGIDIDAEIMSPISRSAAAPAPTIDTFDLTEEGTEDALDAAAAEMDSASVPIIMPNEDEDAVVEAAETALPELEVVEAEPESAAPQTTPDDARETAEAEPPARVVHSLEWEELATAAAAHEVEPLEVPTQAESETTAPVASGSPPQIDPHFLDLPPTFGNEETPPSLSLSPLSPETLAAIP